MGVVLMGHIPYIMLRQGPPSLSDECTLKLDNLVMNLGIIVNNDKWTGVYIYK